MPKLRVASFALALAAVPAACSDPDRASAPQQSSSGGRSSGGLASVASGGASQGGARGGAGGNAGANDAGAAGDVSVGGEGGSVSEPTPPLCSPEQTWGAGERLPISGVGDDQLAGVSGDELSIAWFADGELRYADRASKGADFGAPVTVAPGEGYFGGATLNGDGLALIAVRKDGKSFGLLRRSSRSEAFAGSFDEAPFVNIAAAPGSFRARGPFGDPILSPNGLSLFYSNLDAELDGVPSVYESMRLGARDAWPFGAPVEGELLFASVGSFRRPSAISADKRTLFYADEAAHESRAAFRSFASGPFETWVALGERSHAVPNAACDRLYYSAPGTQGIDLFVTNTEP